MKTKNVKLADYVLTVRGHMFRTGTGYRFVKVDSVEIQVEKGGVLRSVEADDELSQTASVVMREWMTRYKERVDKSGKEKLKDRLRKIVRGKGGTAAARDKVLAEALLSVMHGESDEN